MVVAIPYRKQVSAHTSSIINDAKSGVCMITILSACDCAGCDATIYTDKGEEKCFSTVAVKDTDDDNGDCHERNTKCNLDVGQKYTVKCSGDWDSGAKLQIGSLEVCDGKAETVDFVASSYSTSSPRAKYKAIMKDKGIKSALQKYGWTGSTRTCLSAELGSIDFEKDNKMELGWGDGDDALKEAISVRPTCKDVDAPDGMEVLRACLEKLEADDKAAASGDGGW